jgi:hypothetical protein
VSANTSYLERPWRVGRHVPRHIYVQLGADPSAIDPEIAVAVGPDHLAEVIAYTIVETHNRELDRRDGT